MNGNSDALFFYLVKLMRNVVIINRLKIDIESNENILDYWICVILRVNC